MPSEFLLLFVLLRLCLTVILHALSTIFYFI